MNKRPPHSQTPRRTTAMTAFVLAALMGTCVYAAEEDGAFESCMALGASRPETVGAVSVVADDYPLVSMGLREEGRAVVDVDVAADGMISGLRIAETSGSFRLDVRSIEIVGERWRFRPALLAGTPIACTTQVAVRWDLTNVRPVADGSGEAPAPNVQISEELMRLLGVKP